MNKMFGILFLVNFFLSFYSVIGLNEYSTCLSTSMTHLESFNNQDKGSLCLTTGSNVVYKNKWIRVTMHSNLDTTLRNTDTSRINWDLTKIYIELYDNQDEREIPIEVFSSDFLNSDCAVDCFLGLSYTGYNKSLNIIMQHQESTNVLYLQYPKADITLFLRKVERGLNLGIRSSQNLNLESNGNCVLGCSNKIDRTAVDCLWNTNGVSVAERYMF